MDMAKVFDGFHNIWINLICNDKNTAYIFYMIDLYKTFYLKNIHYTYTYILLLFIIHFLLLSVLLWFFLI
jgi:hypothetical protein